MHISYFNCITEDITSHMHYVRSLHMSIYYENIVYTVITTEWHMCLKYWTNEKHYVWTD